VVITLCEVLLVIFEILVNDVVLKVMKIRLMFRDRLMLLMWLIMKVFLVVVVVVGLYC